MRYTQGILVAAVLVMAGSGTARPGEGKTARTIIDRAIAAVGGDAVLEKLKASTWKEKGTYYGMGKGQPYVGAYAVQWPDQFRMEIEGVFTIVLNGDKGWIKAGGETKEMNKEQMASQTQDNRAGWITSLLPLKDKAFTLTALGEAKVGSRPALGVKVTRKDYPEVKLYFDKKSHLLVKAEYQTKSPEQNFKDVTMAITYSDYKGFDGAQVPTKMVMNHDGKLFVEAEVQEFKAVGKLDNKIFARP
jgi:hypothetical protein